MLKKQIKGIVSSDKMDKTVTVTVDLPKFHPVYQKLTKVTRKYKARDEMNCKTGDRVVIEETLPFSKNVTWKVVENLTAEDKKEE